MATQFPMRPQLFAKLTRANVLAVVHDLAQTHIIQPKLNGDRVVLRKIDGRLVAESRFGKPYSFSVHAATDWAGLPDGTVLDGEGWQGHFWPFEAVIDATVEERVAEAKRLCAVHRRPFIFDAPTDAWLLNASDNLPQWEGIVAKERGTAYEWLGKPARESWQWLKAKW